MTRFTRAQRRRRAFHSRDGSVCPYLLLQLDRDCRILRPLRFSDCYSVSIRYRTVLGRKYPYLVHAYVNCLLRVAVLDCDAAHSCIADCCAAARISRLVRELCRFVRRNSRFTRIPGLIHACRGFCHCVRRSRQYTVRLRQRDSFRSLFEVSGVCHCYSFAEIIRPCHHEFNRHVCQRTGIIFHRLRDFQFCLLICVRYINCSAGYCCFNCTAGCRLRLAHCVLDTMVIRFSVRVSERVAAFCNCVLSQLQPGNSQRVLAPGRVLIAVAYSVRELFTVVCCRCPGFPFYLELQASLLLVGQVVCCIPGKALVDRQFAKLIRIHKRYRSRSVCDFYRIAQFLTRFAVIHFYRGRPLVSGYLCTVCYFAYGVGYAVHDTVGLRQYPLTARHFTVFLCQIIDALSVLLQACTFYLELNIRFLLCSQV